MPVKISGSMHKILDVSKKGKFVIEICSYFQRSCLHMTSTKSAGWASSIDDYSIYNPPQKQIEGMSICEET